MAKGKEWTEQEEGAALQRIYAEHGVINKTLYMAHCREGEPTVEGMIWRAGGWNSLMERHGLPITYRAGRSPRRKPVDRLAKPASKAKRRLCLKCDKAFTSVHFTCDRCRKINQQYVEEYACL